MLFKDWILWAREKQQKDNKTKEGFDCDLEYHWLLHTITCFAHIECNHAGANAIVAHIPVNKQLSWYIGFCAKLKWHRI